ncbi:FkbM family methyltransferase [Streptomyces sp. NPDC050164]|uniref:FkbM family methyltransferase n=1 Tax=Streptomyces sp. NPDC050164 TaxID=3365605 RepID=UPI0037AE222A
MDVSRYPKATPEYRATQLLRRYGVDLVLDVGANNGGYSTMLRRNGYRGRIVSFEPVREPFTHLRVKAAHDPLWTVMPFAIGDVEGTVEIHVAGNQAASSSVLGMLPRHAEAVPSSQYIASERVPQRTLNSLWPEVVSQGDRVFLKLDVQGGEKQALVGAGERLSQCVGVQLEISFLPLYEGGMLYREALDWVGEWGFTPAYVLPGFTDPRTGQMYQCDVVSFRE